MWRTQDRVTVTYGGFGPNAMTSYPVRESLSGLAASRHNTVVTLPLRKVPKLRQAKKKEKKKST